jgi:hypothetical protein
MADGNQDRQPITEPKQDTRKTSKNGGHTIPVQMLEAAYSAWSLGGRALRLGELRAILRIQAESDNHDTSVLPDCAIGIQSQLRGVDPGSESGARVIQKGGRQEDREQKAEVTMGART